jgi:hypothetical protein
MPSQIKEIENGRKTLSRSELKGYALLMEAPAGAVPVAIGFAEATMPSADRDAHPWEATPEDRLIAERAALETGATVRRAFLDEGRAKRYAADRAEAERLWAVLAPQKPERRRLMARAKAFRTWGLIERLCIESLKEAPRDPEAARSVAELAVEVARRLPPLPGFSDRLEGYAQAHLGNALRVKTDFNEADRIFCLVANLWMNPFRAKRARLERGWFPISKLLCVGISAYSPRRSPLWSARSPSRSTIPLAVEFCSRRRMFLNTREIPRVQSQLSVSHDPWSI